MDRTLCRNLARLALTVLLAALIAAPPSRGAVGTIPDAVAAAVQPGTRQHGVASYYAERFDGRTTASGERYDERKLTAAHRTLPLGTRVRVTEQDTGRSVVVTVNDRGPYVAGRAIDLSRRAGERLGMIEDGLADVIIEVLQLPRGQRGSERLRSGASARDGQVEGAG